MRRSWWFSFLLLVCAGVGHAAPIPFTYTARVTYSDGSLSGTRVGTLFEGTFTYDSALPGSVVVPGQVYYFGGPDSSITASIAGHQVRSTDLSILVVDDYGGNVEDFVHLYGTTPVVVDGIALPTGSFGFSLASAPGHGDVLPNASLPTSYDVAAFDAGPTLNYGLLLRDGTGNGTILEFALLDIRVVPEPSALVLALGGLCALTSVRRRRRA